MAMMRPALPIVVEAVAAFEMAHEGVDALTRGRQMASNHDVMLRTRAPFARRDHELAIGASDPEHLLGRVAIERAVQP